MGSDRLVVECVGEAVRQCGRPTEFSGPAPLIHYLLSTYATSGDMMQSPTTPVQGTLLHPFGTSPTSAHTHTLTHTHTRGLKRSASTDDEGDHEGDTRPSSSSRRNTAVKRACNECRQQKVSGAEAKQSIHAAAMRRPRTRKAPSRCVFHRVLQTAANRCVCSSSATSSRTPL